MLAMSPSVRRRRALIVAIGVVLALTTVAEAATGKVRISILKSGFIVGVGGGSGTLDFKGRRYRLRVGGMSAGTIGVARADLIGTAQNLQRPDDITGTYSAASASVSVIGGQKVARLQNEKGVVLELKGRQLGFEASLNLGGVSIRLE